MTEKDFGQEVLVSDDSKEALREYGNTPDFLEENEHAQSELMQLKKEVSGESREKEVVTPITRQDIDSLERLHS